MTFSLPRLFFLNLFSSLVFAQAFAQSPFLDGYLVTI